MTISSQIIPYNIATAIILLPVDLLSATWSKKSNLHDTSNIRIDGQETFIEKNVGRTVHH